ncbi:MAG: RNB domain-containing ribonuclease [Gammaproteobacteria bacterium]|nr:RNB domain-containing ribonuclease [Gammaproteobacteria bacterium]
MSNTDTSPKLPLPTDIIADVLARFDLMPTHPQDCLDEARYWLDNPGLDDPRLTDWRDLPFVTIDNPDSKDLDQALYIEKSSAGFRLRYALADAAYYIRPDSALFIEALRRGASYYLPNQAVAMLPRELSEDLVSLNPKVDRRSLVFDIVLSEQGTVEKTTVVRALICSQAKLNYAGVQIYLDALSQGKGHGYKHTPFGESLRLLQLLGELLIAKADDRDVITYDRVEADIKIEGDPPRFTLGERRRYDTERYNEQLSLICNMEGAKLFTALLPQEQALQPIFRVHEPPLKQAHNKLRSALESLIETRKLDQRWHWHQHQPLADYVQKLPRNGQDERLAKAIERQILMTNRASEFRAEPGRHYALRAPSYARFSSPMREIVGIFTHKELLDALGDKAASHPEDAQHQADIIAAGNRAKQTQKMLDKALQLEVIHQILTLDLVADSAPRHRGTVMGGRSEHLYVAVDAFAIDLKVYRQDLNEQYNTQYSFTDISATSDAGPEFFLGDEVELSVRGYDAMSRRYALSLWLA